MTKFKQNDCVKIKGDNCLYWIGEDSDFDKGEYILEEYGLGPILGKYKEEDLISQERENPEKF